MRARELVKSCSMEELLLGFGDDPPMVPRVCLEIPIAKYQEEHPETNAEFLAGRDQLLQKVDANPGDPRLLSVLDPGNLLAVATALHQRCPDKTIVIAGDDDHRAENNSGREKALAAAEVIVVAREHERFGPKTSGFQDHIR
jgi:hypothetical protein